MEPSSFPLVIQKKRRREDDKMDDERKKVTHLHQISITSPTSPTSPSIELSQSSPPTLPIHTFESLPLEIILYILSHLSPRQLLAFSCISPKCKNLTYNSVLWQSVNIDDSDHSKNRELLPFESFKKINIKLLALIKEISLVEATCRNFNDGAFSHSLLWICKKCIGLQKLRLGWCGSLLNADIFSLTQENIHLSHLSMKFNPILISDVGITMLARFGLQKLELSLFKNITFSGLREFLMKCKSVRQLVVDMCGCIDDDSLCELRKLFPHVSIMIPSEDKCEVMKINENNSKRFSGIYISNPKKSKSSSGSSDDDSSNKYYYDSDSSYQMFSDYDSNDGTIGNTINGPRNGNGKSSRNAKMQPQPIHVSEDENSKDGDFRPSDDDDDENGDNDEDEERGENSNNEGEEEEGSSASEDEDTEKGED